MWTLSADEHTAVVEEIERLEDRGAALVAGAFLEERLQELLLACFADDPDVIGQMFRGSGPFASFSAKINLAYLMKLYEESIRKKLHTIRRIRNVFAHTIQPTTFDSQRVKDLCDNLPKIHENFWPEPDISSFEPSTPDNPLTDEQFEIIKNFLFSNIFNRPDTPRNRFMATIQVMLLHLSITRTLSTDTLIKHPLAGPQSSDEKSDE